jgi:hypothetical protein
MLLRILGLRILLDSVLQFVPLDHMPIIIRSDVLLFVQFHNCITVIPRLINASLDAHPIHNITLTTQLKLVCLFALGELLELL